MMGTLLQDLKYGLRMLAKHPGVAAMAVITLALGVGANTAIFSLVNGCLIRPMPVPDPERLAVLAVSQQGAPLGALGLSYPQFSEFRKQSGAFCEVIGQRLALVTLSADGRTDQVPMSGVTSNYFSVLQVKPALGRLVLPSDGEGGGAPGVVVLGYSYWQHRFGGDAGVVGRQVRVEGRPATIIGVVPKEFGSTSILEMDAYVSLDTLYPQGSGNKSRFWTDRNVRLILAMGRLAKGLSLREVQKSLDVISARLAKQYPATDQGVSVRAIPERLSRPIPYANNSFIMIAALFLVLGVLVLLVACTNIANLLMARASSQQREMAVRTAVGAGRGRLVRQMLTETLLVALLGGLAGVVLAGWAGRIIGTIQLHNFPLRLDYAFDWRVFAFAFLVVLFTAMSVGLGPALHTTRLEVNTLLHEGGPNSTSSLSRRRVRGDLMAAQVAGSVTLLIVAGLLVRSLRAAANTSLGFDADYVLNVTLDPSVNSYNESQTQQFYRQLEVKIRALPGVQYASQTSFVPMGDIPNKRSVYVEGRPVPPGEHPPRILCNSIGTDYFPVMRIPLVRGRDFTEYDDAFAPRVAIINQTMARSYWPKEDPIGKRFRVESEDGPFVEIVGVSADGKYQFVVEDAQASFYVPLAQNYISRRSLQIRSEASPQLLAGAVQHEIRTLDPDMPILDSRTMKEALEGDAGFFALRLGAAVAAVLGTMGMVLAVVGVYGVVSYTTTERTQEIGIRTALGARRSDILRLVLVQAVRLVLAGVLVGLAGAWALTRTMVHLLVGISPSDPVTYLGVTALLLGVALLACGIPALRATRVDPMVALRYE
ncbi:MAG: ABC transporter permease [Terriglobia bacterium]|jgi:putative ABC transport system permease protein